MSNWAGKTIYIPNMCDHAYILQAVYESLGTAAEVLPPPDDGSTALGMGLVLGRECTPCLLVAGDVIRHFSQPGFDPRRAVLLLPTAAGPCRYGQYSVLLRHLLDEHGLQEVEIASPTADNSYFGYGDRPAVFRLRAWRGLVAQDLLQQLLHAYRPYAHAPEQADAIYQAGLARIVAEVRSGGAGLRQAVAWCGEQFAALPSDRRTPRPLIGLIGEIYLRTNAYSNQSVIRKVEELGGEVSLATTREWLYYTNWWAIDKARMRRNYRAIPGTYLADLYQRFQEYRLAQPVARLLHHPYETRTAVLMHSIVPYLEPAISTEVVLTLGKAIEFAHQGASGILNVMPFSCMPGIISAGIAPRVRRDLDDIPWLDLSYDLQKTTNLQTRLEAFMVQATHYQRRRAAQGTAMPRRSSATAI